MAYTASEEEIKTAYRKLAGEYHPDHLPQDASPEEKAKAEEKMKKLNKIKETLLTPEKRREYDLTLPECLFSPLFQEQKKGREEQYYDPNKFSN